MCTEAMFLEFLEKNSCTIRIDSNDKSRSIISYEGREFPIRWIRNAVISIRDEVGLDCEIEYYTRLIEAVTQQLLTEGVKIIGIE